MFCGILNDLLWYHPILLCFQHSDKRCWGDYTPLEWRIRDTSIIPYSMAVKTSRANQKSEQKTVSYPKSTQHNRLRHFADCRHIFPAHAARQFADTGKNKRRVLHTRLYPWKILRRLKSLHGSGWQEGRPVAWPLRLFSIFISSYIHDCTVCTIVKLLEDQ